MTTIDKAKKMLEDGKKIFFKSRSGVYALDHFPTALLWVRAAYEVSRESDDGKRPDVAELRSEAARYIVVISFSRIKDAVDLAPRSFSETVLSVLKTFGRGTNSRFLNHLREAMRGFDTLLKDPDFKDRARKCIADNKPTFAAAIDSLCRANCPKEAAYYEHLLH